MKATEDQLHPPRVIGGKIYVAQADLSAFIASPHYEAALKAGHVIQLVRADGTMAQQICCPQDRLPCGEDVERLEADNAKLRGVLRELVDSLPKCRYQEHKSAGLHAATYCDEDGVFSYCDECIVDDPDLIEATDLDRVEYAAPLRAALEALKP